MICQYFQQTAVYQHFFAISVPVATPNYLFISCFFGRKLFHQVVTSSTTKSGGFLVGHRDRRMVPGSRRLRALTIHFCCSPRGKRRVTGASCGRAYSSAGTGAVTAPVRLRGYSSRLQCLCDLYSRNNKRNYGREPYSVCRNSDRSDWYTQG